MVIGFLVIEVLVGGLYLALLPGCHQELQHTSTHQTVGLDD